MNKMILASCMAMTLAGCSSAQVAQRMAAQVADDDAACRAVEMDYAACRQGLVDNRAETRTRVRGAFRNLAEHYQRMQEIDASRPPPATVYIGR